MDLVYEPVDETLWGELRTLLDWHDRFVLVLLYVADPRPVAALRRRLNDVLRLQTRSLQVIAPNDAETAVAETMAALLGGSSAGNPQPSPAWVELFKAPTNEAWNQARDAFLARLNERRSALERDQPGMVVICLPPEYLQRIPTLAPDLWSVRNLSKVVAPIEGAQSQAIERRHETGPRPLGRETPQETRLNREWKRVSSVGDPRRVDPLIALDLVALAVERGAIARALEVASEAVNVALVRWQEDPASNAHTGTLLRAHASMGDALMAVGRVKEAGSSYGEALRLSRLLVLDVGETPQALRDVCVSLNNVGRVESELGQWEAAGEAYRESLALSRHLAKEIGETAQALRDVSVSLDNVGQAEHELGRMEAAGDAYRESLALSRRIATEIGETPQALRDVSVALSNVGRVESELGHWEAVGDAHRESLALSRRLATELGETPQALRDVSVVLSNVGRVESELGRWDAAVEAYRESLALTRRLAKEIGESPQALRDVSVSLNHLGRVERELGRWEAAGEAYRESLALSRRLAKEIGETPQALRDVSVSLDSLGHVEGDLGHWVAAGEAYGESLELSRRLAKEIGETPQALRDLSIGLNNVGRVERELGRWEAADEAYRESLALRRRLAMEIGETSQALEDVAISEWGLAQVAMGQRDREAERSHLSEAIANMKRASAASPTALRLRNNVQQLEARLRVLNSIDSE